jgi:hypothetical protein
LFILRNKVLALSVTIAPIVEHTQPKAAKISPTKAISSNGESNGSFQAITSQRRRTLVISRIP